MNAILRIMYPNRIEDIDLSSRISPVRVGSFTAAPGANGWGFVQGNRSGMLQINRGVVIDREKKVAALVIEKVAGSVRYIELSDGITIGSDKGNQIVMEDPIVSGKHCRIERKGLDWFLVDGGSTNGTYLNDKKMLRSPLKQGDVIKIGRYVLKMGSLLQIVNADDRVIFHVPLAQPGGRELFVQKPYPWFSPAARMHQTLEHLTVDIQSAPTIGEKPSMGLGMIALDPVAMAMSVGMQALRYGLGKKKYSKKEQERAEIYARYLAEIEAQLKEHGAKQRNHEEMLHPSLRDCLNRVIGPAENLWEKHVSDEDFLTVRLGLGTVPAKAVIHVPGQRLQLQEDELADVPQVLAEKYAVVEDVPVVCDLMKDGNCGIVGSREAAVALVQSMVAQIAALHPYNEVKIVVVASEQEREKWSWMRWLPHCNSDNKEERYLYIGNHRPKEMESLDKICKARMDGLNEWNYGKNSQTQPHYVVIVAEPSLLNHSSLGAALMLNQAGLGISGIFLGSQMTDFPHSVRNIVEVQPSVKGLAMRLRAEGRSCSLVTKECEVPRGEYERFARGMAPIRLRGIRKEEGGFPASISLLEGLQVREVAHLELGDFWENALPEKTLAVPIGIMENGEHFLFDIHEKGHGVHGLVAGQPGSGKSQMAQTWIASLAMHFSPQDVNFVLVDFKGDSLLQPFLKLPHLAGSISNLDADIARSFSALEGELHRRQSLFSEYGCGDIRKYMEARRYHSSMPNVPYLIVIIDEFAEFKRQFPDFTKPLEHIYQIGRSLGLFIVLMTQSPAGVVTTQMLDNAAFRWCLSVNSESASRELLGTGDGTKLRNPGRAYVKSGEVYELMQTYYAGAPFQKYRKKESSASATVSLIGLNGERTSFGSGDNQKKYTAHTELDALVERICDYCTRRKIPAAEAIWKKELPKELDLFSMVPSWEQAGWTGRIAAEQGPTANFGLVDDPVRQSQYPLCHDFWQDGHMAVYGMPLSGKTTFLRTIQIALSQTYHPEQVQMYSLDFGGFGLRSIENLPHVGAAAGDDEPESMTKLLEVLLEELALRKKMFRKAGAGSPDAYLEATEESLPTVILFADNYNLAGSHYPEVSAGVLKIAREGATYGMYLVCSFAGTTGVNYTLLSNFKKIYALQLAEKSEYNSIVGRPKGTVPAGIRGRGLAKGEEEPLLFQTAIPYEELSDGKRMKKLRDIAERMKDAWKGKLPKGIFTMPEDVCYGSLEGKPFILGLDKEEGNVISVPWKEHQSLVISDGAYQKTALMTSLIRQAAEIEDSEIYLFTNHRSSYEPYMKGHRITASGQELDGWMVPFANELRARQKQLKENPEVVFPPFVILLDDYGSCIKSCQEETIARLEVFIRLGKGLGVFVAAADTAEKMGKCRFQGDILTATMREGHILLAGGNFPNHQITDTYGLSAKHPGPLEAGEGALLKNGEEVKFMQIMQGE